MGASTTKQSKTKRQVTIMKIDKAAIQSFLETNPTPGEINTILYAIAEYRRELELTDGIWKKQLPSAKWGDLTRRELLRDIIRQLQSQGISISYHRDYSEDHTHYWRLRRGMVKGGLTWNREDDRFTLWLFNLASKDGEKLPQFESVKYQSFCEWW